MNLHSFHTLIISIVFGMVMFKSPTLAKAAPAPASWQTETVYQIYPRSFFDGNGDGIGDLQGIIHKLDYIKSLGVDIVWLCPVNKTTNYDNGYDISDYLEIDESFGSLQDWQQLREGLHQRGMKIMMDLVLNHTSDAHPWFLQDVARQLLTSELQAALSAQAKENDKEFAPFIKNLLLGQLSPNTVLSPNQQHWAERIAYFKDKSTFAEQRGYLPAAAQLQALAAALQLVPAKAGANKDSGYFYIWREQPNNWTSIFSGSAWHQIKGTHASYLALFSKHQPDLDWRNPTVRRAMRGMIETWVARGVDAFRLDSVGFLGKHPDFPDAPPEDTARMGRGMQYFINRPEVHVYLRELNAFLAAKKIRTVGEISFSGLSEALRYAGFGRKELTEVFLFDHVYVDIDKDKWHAKPFDLARFKQIITHQQKTIHARAWVANYLENHDQLRAVSRFGNDTQFWQPSAKMLATLLFSLEGTPYIYQGQEIGMTNTTFSSLDEINDIEARNYYQASLQLGESQTQIFSQVAARNRDHVRTVMQWNSSEHSGFSQVKPWIKANENHKSINVANQDQDPNSILNYYRKLIALRKTDPTLVLGNFELLLPHDPALLAYLRTGDEARLMVLLNFSAQAVSIPLDPNLYFSQVPQLLVSNYEAPAAASAGILRPYEARIYKGPAPSLYARTKKALTVIPAAQALEPNSVKTSK